MVRRLRPTPGGGPELPSGERIAPRHIEILIQLANTKEMSVSDIANRLGVNLTAASLSVTQLANVGIVERKEDPEDHRRTIVSIAEPYLKMASEINAEKVVPMRRALGEMGEEKANQLVELLVELEQKVRQQPEFKDEPGSEITG